MIIRLFIRSYQLLASPLLGCHCRFTPSCSHYAMEAVESHGALKGSWIAFRRLLRCHPFGGEGYDPVPQKPLHKDARSADRSSHEPAKRNSIECAAAHSGSI